MKTRPSTRFASLAVSLAITSACVGAWVMGCSSSSTPVVTVPIDSGVDAAATDAATDAMTTKPVDAGLTCPSNQTICGSTCVNTSNDLANCGSCGMTCAAGEVCSNGGCALTCGGGTTKCGTMCNDTLIDPSNCGTCATACGADQVCTAGSCVSTCTSGQVVCNNACVDPNTSNAYCGATNGCGVGDAGNAGAVCGPEQHCVAGACAFACPTGSVVCNGACVDPTTSNAYCGATNGCGNADAGAKGVVCGAGSQCTVADGGAPSCSASCASPLISCSNVCVDPNNDTNHCGGCNACPTGQSCTSGVCNPSTSNLVRYFPFSGDTTDRAEGYTLTNNGATLTTDRHGNANSAYLFNGTSNYMMGAGTGIPFNASARTIMAWIKPTLNRITDGVSVGSYIVTGSGNNTGLMFGLGRNVHAPGGPTATATDLYFWGGSSVSDYDSTTVIPLNTWSFVAVSFSGTTIATYVNGTKTTAARTLATTSSNLWLGCETTNDNTTGIRDYFTGALDEVRVYSRVLTDAEIATFAAL
jgi:hypothetical protein